MLLKRLFPPLSLPVCFFAVVIGFGAVLLHQPVSLANGRLSWVDALFTATSATCVTGLAVVDTGSRFSPLGQTVLLLLIQIGGLGIMTFTSLALYLRRRRISLTDQIAVGQSLLHDATFHLGHFLKQLVALTLIIEAIGAVLLWLMIPDFSPFAALFHAVSAFCNAGFSLQSDSLMAFAGDWGVNLVFMVLIILGGLGFSVLIELNTALVLPRQRGEMAGRPPHRYSFALLFRLRFLRGLWHRLFVQSRRIRGRSILPRHGTFSWYTISVVQTSGVLILLGWGGILLADFVGFNRDTPGAQAVLTALFQSVTCRTAGFNTVAIDQMTNVSLLLMLILMFIGGAPGSCAGGIKVTTFRVLTAFIGAQFRGREQVVVGRLAVERQSVNRALLLTFMAGVLVLSATLLLSITEGGELPHPEIRGLFFDLLFEVVSAFGTVGLSLGITAKLSAAGKVVLTLVMFIGRLGPLVFLAAIQSIRREEFYRRPEEPMLIG